MATQVHKLTLQVRELLNYFVLVCSPDPTTNSGPKNPELSKMKYLTNTVVLDENNQNK